jgi:hypothetical protein
MRNNVPVCEDESITLQRTDPADDTIRAQAHRYD